MANKENSLANPSESSAHYLKGKALKQWWQIGRGQQYSKYRNNAIKHHLVFLICLPFFAMFCYHKIGALSIKLILLGAVVWSADFMMLLAMLKRRLFYVLEVQQFEDGLLLRSLFFRRKIQWLEVQDFFGIQAAGIPKQSEVQIQNNDFMLDSTSGEQFILSSELTDSALLFEDIKHKVPPPTLTCDCNYHVPDEYFDSVNSAIFAMAVAFMFGFLKSFVYSAHPDLTELGACVAILAISFFIWWLHSSKMAQLVRIRSSSIFICTRSGSHVLAWDRIANIKQLGGYFLIKARDEWYLILAGKKGPLADKLLECKRNLLTITRTHL